MEGGRQRLRGQEGRVGGRIKEQQSVCIPLPQKQTHNFDALSPKTENI